VRFPPRRWGSVVIWLAANGLRCLVVVALIAWANPLPLHWHVEAVPHQPLLTRVIQIKPCPPWAEDRGSWYGQHVCVWAPGAQAQYRRFLKNA
jgi:hypothetical protein